MSDAFRKQTIYETGGDAVLDAFHNQVVYCRTNDAPVTARVVEALGALVGQDGAGEMLRRVREWQGPPLADALPLRLAGGVHSLHLDGSEPALGPIYRNEPADDLAILGDVIARREGDLLPWLDGPPQTNEAGRSSSFIAAMLWLAGQGLPPRFECLRSDRAPGST